MPRSVLITGCSSGGIGHAMAKEFHSQGLQVFATARRKESMEELAKLGITTIVLDVTDVSNIQRVRDEISAVTGGKLDILVNNAGQILPVASTDMAMDDVRAVFEVNVFAPISMVQQFAELLIASGDGRIVDIGSVVGIIPLPFGSAYNASKAALHAFNNTIRVELAPFNIKVINVITGGVKSTLGDKSVKYTMPENSLYKRMEDLYQEKRLPSSSTSTPADVYVKVVVAEAVKAKPRAWIWVGNGSFITWFIDTFFPRTLWDFLFSKRFGLSEFTARIKTDKKTA